MFLHMTGNQVRGKQLEPAGMGNGIPGFTGNNRTGLTERGHSQRERVIGPVVICVRSALFRKQNNADLTQTTTEKTRRITNGFTPDGMQT